MDDLPSAPAEIIALMSRLFEENIIVPGRVEFQEAKLDAIFTDLNITIAEMITTLTFDFTDVACVTDYTPEWKFMLLNFYCLHLLSSKLKHDMLSVSQTKDLRKYVNMMIHVGILQNLNPKIHHFKPLRTGRIEVEKQYYLLKASLCGLFKFALMPTLRYHILVHVLQYLLAALYQLAYCPIIKPSSSTGSGFKMTEKFYSELIEDQDRFQGLLELLRKSVNPEHYLKETMLLIKKDSPKWFKKSVSYTLTCCVKQQEGLETIIRVMLCGDYNDNTTMWKTIHIVTQIILDSLDSKDFNSCIRPQIENLLKPNVQFGGEVLAFEKLFASIVKSIISQNEEQGNFFLNIILTPVKKLSQNPDYDNFNSRGVCGKSVVQSVRIIHYIFLDKKDVLPPLDILTPYMSILFYLYMKIENSKLVAIKTDLKEIITHYMKSLNKEKLFIFWNKVIFNFTFVQYLQICPNLAISTDENMLEIQDSPEFIRYDVVGAAHSVYTLCGTSRELYFSYLSFFLQCLSNSDKYFPDVSLLDAEDEGSLSAFEKKISVYEMLSVLSVDGMKRKYFNDHIPQEMFECFEEIFNNAIKKGSYNNKNDAAFQLVFTITMILENIVSNTKYDLVKIGLLKSIKTIYEETKNVELKSLLHKILTTAGKCDAEDSPPDDLEETIQETFDESIPIKGHGLIALEKFVAAKHPTAVKRTQYIFTVFKENLMNRDTYIYLAAIKGLTSLADINKECTLMVLETLCDEYAEFPQEEFGVDVIEIRLKIGEILVQISRRLGEMAPSYKALLLNNFLNGTKDDDHLVRASALSNLGEICKVLGFKLGGMSTEILVCVDAIVKTDKYDEPRRAAISLIRQLLAGLGTHMLTFLKDDILQIYRTLKFVYNNDKDDVAILHAQLALEEIDENMKGIMFPKAEIDAANKIVVLK